MILLACTEVGVRHVNGLFAPKLDLSQFYQISTTLDHKLLGSVSSVASIEEARELLEQLGLSADAAAAGCAEPEAAATPARSGGLPRLATPPLAMLASTPLLLPTPLGSPTAERGGSTTPFSPLQAGGGMTSSWLSLKPGQKGRGPRGSIYLHDEPPTKTDVVTHYLRVVERKLSQRQHQAPDHGASEKPKTRTVGDMLRLPQLSDEELARCENSRSRLRVLPPDDDDDGDVNDECSPPVEKISVQRPHHKPPILEQQISAAIHNDQLRANYCNALIDQTYRRARDIGVSTASCLRLIQRGAAEKAKRKEIEQLERKKKKLRDRFVL
jgi:hypothetical protein